MYGIELLNANAQLEVEDDGNLVVINEALGEGWELPLGAREGSVGYRTKPKPQV